jgi:hypothetical protein
MLLAFILQVCDVAVLTQLTELQLIGRRMLQGDLQPLSNLWNLVELDWNLKGGPVPQQEWTARTLQEAQQ